MAIKNYIKVFEDGSQVATKQKPVFGLNNVRTEAGYNPDVYVDGKWYNSTNGSELVTNGTFDTDLNSWTLTGAVTWSNGMALTDYTEYIEQNITTTVGKKYRLTFNLSTISGTGGSYIYIDDVYGRTLTTGNIVFDFVAQNTTTNIKLGGYYSSSQVGYDNISVFETEIEPATAYTSQPTYLPYVVNLDESGNVIDYDKFDIPTLVEDYIKADIVEGEHKGKNSCTAWVNFDGTTTPPTIRDSYNVSQVIRTATGNYEIHFETFMDNNNYSISGIAGLNTNDLINVSQPENIYPKSVDKVLISTPYVNTTSVNAKIVSVQIFGGKQ